MVTTNALMVVRCLVLVEGVRGQVEHTVIQGLIAQDELIGLRHLLGCLALALGHKHLIVQVTLVYLPKVDEAEHQDSADGIFGLEFAIFVSHEQYHAHDDNPERTPAISCKHGCTHINQITDKWLDVLLWQGAESTHLAG